jgi:hypothetical protein
MTLILMPREVWSSKRWLCAWEQQVICRVGDGVRVPAPDATQVSSAPPSLTYAGELHDYVVGELNVRELEVCADPLKYATLRAEPDFQVRV